MDVVDRAAHHRMNHSSHASASSTRDVWLLTFVFGLAFLFRIGWFVHDLPAIGGDEVDYDVLARNLHAGLGFVVAPGQFTAFRTPGLPWLMSPFYALYPNHLPFVMRTLALVSCLIAPLIYFFSRRIFGDVWRPLLAATLWAASTTSIRQAGKFMGEELGAFLLLGGFALCVVAERKRSTALGAIAGLVLGLSSLTRGYLLVVTLVPIVWLLMRRAPKALVAATLLATLVIPVGWMARNAVRLGSATYSTEATIQLWLGNGKYARGGWPGSQYMDPHSEMWEGLRTKYPGFDQFSEVQRAKVYGREFVSDLRSAPGHVAWLLPRKLLIYLGPISYSYAGIDWLYAFAAPFFLLGLLVLWKRRELATLVLLGLPVVLVGLVCLMTFGDPRFRHPVDPLILVLAGCGLAACPEWLRTRRLA